VPVSSCKELRVIYYCLCLQVEPLTIIDDPADWKAKVGAGAQAGQCLQLCTRPLHVWLTLMTALPQVAVSCRHYISAQPLDSAWPEPLPLLRLPPPQPLQDLSPESYTYQLSPAEVAEIIAGTDAILARGVKDEEDIKKVGGGGSSCAGNQKGCAACSASSSRARSDIRVVCRGAK
jgi:hypothetical protein